MDLIEHLNGPYGGMLAMAFGTGCMAGYSFATKTTLAGARERIAELKAEMDRLHDELIAERDRHIEALRKMAGDA